MELQKNQNIAFVMSRRLGDSLLSMIVVRSLVLCGYRVTVFGDYLHALRNWFPDVEIHPRVSELDARAKLGAFDVLIHAYDADVIGDTPEWHPRVIVLDHWPAYRQVKNMVAIQRDISAALTETPVASSDNGMRAPPHLTHRGYAQRIILHPVASDLQKSWLPRRFLSLAKQLKKEGFEPQFLVMHQDLRNWRWLSEHGFEAVALASLDEVAALVYESGWVIGNDSGIGHLASNLGVPTVSLAMRRRIASRWRPGWAPSRAVVPLPLLPSRYLKERFWKHLLPTSRVLGAFQDLRQEYGERRTTRSWTTSVDGRTIGTTPGN